MGIAASLDESPHVIVGWRDAWRMHSVQASAIGFVFNASAAAAAQAFGAGALIGVLPVSVVLLIGAVLFGLGLLGRLLVQPHLAGKIDASDSAGA